MTAKNSPKGSVRVVNLSSIGHYVVPSDGIQWSTLAPGGDYLEASKKIGALKLYGQSKLVMKLVFQYQQPFFDILRCRAISCFRTKLLGNTAMKALCPLPYTQEIFRQTSGVIVVLSNRF